MKFIKGRQLKGEKGFTLMELMVVVLILGLIAAYAVPTYLSSIATSKLGMVIANYDAVRTEVWSGYYAPGSTASSVETAVLANTTGLTNPFTGSAVIDNDDTVVAGAVRVDGATSGQVTVTAYDNSSTPASMNTETISDPKS